MTNLPNVGIIISNYNYGEYVINAIDSALSQKYEGEIRVCVVDDGSSDDSWEKICSITDKKETIHVAQCYDGDVEFRQKDNLYAYRIDNCGASVARNVGLYCLWDWAHIFGILDADDEYYQDKVDILTAKLMEHPELGVTYADYDIHRTFNDLNYTKYEYKQPYNKMKLLNECIVHSGALIKKEYLNVVKLPTEEFYDSNLHGPLSKGFIGCTEDYDLWLRLAEVCVIAHVAKPLSLVRETGNNQSMRMNPEIFSQNINFIQNRNKNV